MCRVPWQGGGVIVAEIQADLEGHGVTVNSHEALDIYQSTKELQITGEGFKDGVKVTSEALGKAVS